MNDTQRSQFEVLRWCAALCGVFLWFGYVWVALKGLGANAQQYCAEKSAIGETCSYDYIPIVELVFIPAFVLLFAYPFIRFALMMYAPSMDARRLPWGAVGATGAMGRFPVAQVFAGLGLGWSIFRLAALPFAFISGVVIAYWIAWIVWFSGAIIASWPDKESAD